MKLFVFLCSFFYIKISANTIFRLAQSVELVVTGDDGKIRSMRKMLAQISEQGIANPLHFSINPLKYK